MSYEKEALLWRQAFAALPLTDLFCLLWFITSPHAHAELHDILVWDPLPAYLPYVKTFYQNQLITIGWGSFNFLSNAITPGVCNGGIDDTLAAVANIYIVHTTGSGSIYRNSSIRLPSTDVSGRFNTVVQDSGFFQDETIGSTAPIGTLTEGYYDVIYDECQDGYFDDGIDFLMKPAFRVGVKVPPGPPDDIMGVKASAAQRAGADARVGALTGVLWAVSTFSSVSGDAFDFALWIYETVLPGLFPDSLSDPFLEVTKLIADKMAQDLAIAADPPDADFQQLTPLSGRQIIDPQNSDPLLIAVANVGTASSTQGALAEALLHALERYQGAEAAGAGGWALTHARAIKQYATLLAAHMSQMNDALAQLSNALANDTRPLDSVAAALESERARVESAGFSVEEQQIFASLGLTVAQMNALQADLATRSFVFTKAALMQAITDA